MKCDLSQDRTGQERKAMPAKDDIERSSDRGEIRGEGWEQR